MYCHSWYYDPLFGLPYAPDHRQQRKICVCNHHHRNDCESNHSKAIRILKILCALTLNISQGLAPTLIALSIDNGVTVADSDYDSQPISHLTFRRTCRCDICETGMFCFGLGPDSDSWVQADYSAKEPTIHHAKGTVDEVLSNSGPAFQGEKS